ncbi:sigma-70 family RNA polymerase sigma factor [Streptomyces sp. NPDC047108]|uniref:RNA polymerase sigma factor n=1 Tax=Streptomyces sp. NPDC047108 TaxID=3155025 RepID=UPI003402BB3D
MKANTHAAHTGSSQGSSDERWARMWSHREELLKVARRRSMSVEDAEDAVHEAMLRAMENPHIDDDRLGAWLTTVTMRLCVDRYRQINREAQVGSRSTLAAPPPAPVEDVVCDRAEAIWLAGRSGDLPARQAEALWLKSEDLDVDQVARTMGLSYRTVESLLARARRTMRNSLAGTLGLVLWLLGRGRPRAGSTAQAATVVSTAATLAVLGFAVIERPFMEDGSGPSRPSTGSPDRPGDGGQDVSAVSSGASAVPSRNGGVGLGGLTADVRGMLPQAVTLPGLAVPSVPGVPSDLGIPSVIRAVPSAPSASLPGLPEVPRVPAGSGGVEAPSVPAVPSGSSDLTDLSELGEAALPSTGISAEPSAGLGDAASEAPSGTLPDDALPTAVQP